MKKLIPILFIIMILLCGCTLQQPVTGPTPAPTPTPSPTPNPYVQWAGTWTEETGDGSAVWHLEDDGVARLPEVSMDGYGVFGGYGSWAVGEPVTVAVGKTLTLQPVTEDGFQKFYCPELNTTLVRTADRQAAYGAKFMEVQLSSDNFWNYFYFEQVHSPTDENGERIWKEVFVMRSSLYGQGWLYWGEENVDIFMRYWDSYHQKVEKAPFGVNFLVKNYNEVQASGTLVFIRADHVSGQTYDGKTRQLMCNTGQVWEEQFKTHRYGEYYY